MPRTYAVITIDFHLHVSKAVIRDCKTTENFGKQQKISSRTSCRLKITFSQRLNQINWDFPELLTCEKKIPGDVSLIIIGLILISSLKIMSGTAIL